VLLQSENYYLKTTFKDELKNLKVLSPVFNFSEGYESEKNNFIKMARELGKDKVIASKAFEYAIVQLNQMFGEFKQIGKEFLIKLNEDPERFAIVLFGRSYNSFAKEANLGIPQKFASRNIEIIPHDFLPVEAYESYKHMYWGLGQQVLKTARFVKNHPQLFGTFVTNFSCGLDSFILGYFRNIMGKKPSLTLELDSHSADAGINTRIEAAIDIIKSYRELNKDNPIVEAEKQFIPLQEKDSHYIIDSGGNEISITDPAIKLIVPSMGKIGTELFAAAFRYVGINAQPLPVYNFETLMIGRGNSTCKECLPLQLNAGSMIEYYNNRKDENEKTLFFMAKGDGPCRLGQYHIFLEDLIKKREMKNFGIYTLTDKDSYGGLGNDFVIHGWASLVLSDVLKDIYTAIQAIAVDKNEANKIFEEEYGKILASFDKLPLNEIYTLIEKSALVLSTIEKKESIEEAKKVALIGEIFVRHDEFSRMDLMERLSEKGFVVKTAPIGEYIYYSNYLASKNDDVTLGLGDKVKFKIRDFTQRDIEKKIKKALSKSGFYGYHLTDVEEVIESASPFIKDNLEGEAVLTVGSALSEIIDHTCGVISLGPFGCMPARVAESVLNVEMNIEGKKKSLGKKKNTNLPDIEDLPFLALETDGNLFPQIIQSKIEIFMLQAERLHEKLIAKDEPMVRKYKKAINKFIEKYQTSEWDLPEGETLPQYNSAIPEAD
jgi:predicted nucleotide-binding protein (sugar kinase/HSP70/actin superfamily)